MTIKAWFIDGTNVGKKSNCFNRKGFDPNVLQLPASRVQSLRDVGLSPWVNTVEQVIVWRIPSERVGVKMTFLACVLHALRTQPLAEKLSLSKPLHLKQMSLKCSHTATQRWMTAVLNGIVCVFVSPLSLWEYFLISFILTSAIYFSPFVLSPIHTKKQQLKVSLSLFFPSVQGHEVICL